jgi:hypothetical protein
VAAKQLHRLLCKPLATYRPDQIRLGSNETHSRGWLMPDEATSYSFLAAPTRQPLPSHSSDAADFAEPKPITDLVVIRANEAYAAMGAGDDP